jgi:adenylate kinase family enzyme
MQNPTASFRIIGIAGQIGSGKTSLALELCKRLNAQKVSFGDFVRSEALRRNTIPTRLALQELGETLIAELGPYGFVQRVLNSTDIRPIMILDGIRHIEIWQAIRSFAPRSILIYLDIEEATRLDRLKGRDNLNDGSIKRAMFHTMEENIPRLKSLADIVLIESPLEEMASQALSRIERL